MAAREGRLRPFNKVANMDFEMTAPGEPTYNLGVLWEPKDWFAVGAVYQSGSKTTLAGHYQFQAEPMLRKFVEGMYSSLFGPVLASMLGFPLRRFRLCSRATQPCACRFPAHYQLGFKIKPHDRFQLNVDASYSNWRDWNKLTVELIAP